MLRATAPVINKHPLPIKKMMTMKKKEPSDCRLLLPPCRRACFLIGTPSSMPCIYIFGPKYSIRRGMHFSTPSTGVNANLHTCTALRRCYHLLVVVQLDPNCDSYILLKPKEKSSDGYFMRLIGWIVSLLQSLLLYTKYHSGAYCVVYLSIPF